MKRLESLALMLCVLALIVIPVVTLDQLVFLGY